MRDILITVIIFGSLPWVFRRPDIGILIWTWLSLMSPHRLAWGFAFDMPFAQIVGIVLLLGLVVSKEPKRIPWNAVTVLWLMFVAWMFVTTAFSLVPEYALEGLNKSFKIQFFSFMVLMLINNEQRLKWFVLVVAFSIAFYGIKGGVYTLLNGGQFLVYGPPGSFIRGNNELGLALITVMPLMRFVQMQTTNKWISYGITAALLLCVASIVGTHSRGAFLAIMAMGLFLVWKSRRRFMMVFVMLFVLVPVGLTMVPSKYWERMETIQSYEEDTSATGRINAWWFAWNVAKARPLVGGGFNTFVPELFKVYAPDPDDFHDVHSIYFEILGEQGFVGFLLWFLVALLAYMMAGRTARLGYRSPDTQWQADLGRMCQVSMIGFATGGAFLGLAYFDLYYNIVAIIVINHLILRQHLAQTAQQQEGGALGEVPMRAPHPALGRHME